MFRGTTTLSSPKLLMVSSECVSLLPTWREHGIRRQCQVALPWKAANGIVIADCLGECTSSRYTDKFQKRGTANATDSTHSVPLFVSRGMLHMGGFKDISGHQRQQACHQLFCLSRAH